MGDIKIQITSTFEKETQKTKDFGETFQSINPMFSFSQQVWTPLMDILETYDAIIIKSELAGVKEENILIELEKNSLKISGQRHSYKLSKETTYRLVEIQFGQFERVVYLSSLINPNKVSAQFSNGFLEITLGKKVKSTK